MSPNKPKDPNKVMSGRIGAYTKWANTPDWSAATAPARTAFEQKFLDQADGDPLRAQALRRAYFARLAMSSAKARRTTRETQAEAEFDANLGEDTYE